MVKFWTTFNEHFTFAIQGYDFGRQSPKRCSLRFFCSIGDSNTEPYIVAHNFLGSHARTVDIYRKKYKGARCGSIGTNLVAFGLFSATNTKIDIHAVQRAQDFILGWFLDPLVFGNYPSLIQGYDFGRQKKYKVAQCGSIGINLVAFGFWPATNTEIDNHAIKGVQNLILGWFLDAMNGTNIVGASTQLLVLYGYI
ncbi:hypothetical protein RIF29_35601 [Crotalaria pallida]|uniref:Uncharacterized protein n=1 Tax=Crotalaria pallida TaxID=3830 RepID=A0AAN9EA50_CROPI